MSQPAPAFELPMRKLFAVVLFLSLPLAASADELSFRTLQSGSPFGPTTLFDHGIHGEGQIVAVLDTGLRTDSCYFLEPDASLPPVNTGTPLNGLDWENIDLTRHKVVAYDYLYSCEQYPGAPGCDVPGAAGALDNQGHGTHAAGAALGDKGAPLFHDFGDGVAPAAKLIVQDAGYIGGDSCSQRPGIGCPVELTPILEQVYRQGARIQSNSWGDRQGVPPPFKPPTGNYPQAARDVDAFVWAHPDMLLVFNTGNANSTSQAPPPSSLSAPGCAKNTLQIGGTRTTVFDDDTVSSFTLFGPALDGRIKPDLVGPARVTAADIDFDGNPATCDTSRQFGTSWSAPTIAGAAALVRQYYTDGFYPTGVATPSSAMTPSAALLKATLIAAARPLAWRGVDSTRVAAAPVPSGEQGWGFPVLDDVLYFPGETRQLRVADVPLDRGLASGDTASYNVIVHAGTPFRAVLVWTDPPGTIRPVADKTPQLVNDLDLRVDAAGASWLGNGAAPDRINNVEVVSVATPEEGVYRLTVHAANLGAGPRQSYALVMTGDFGPAAPRRRTVRH